MSENSPDATNRAHSERPPVPPDRDALAHLVFRNRPRLLARVRRRIGPAAWARLDPDEIFSSGLRRLDLLWVRHVFPVSSESEFWALVMTVFFNAAIDKAKLWKAVSDSASLAEVALDGSETAPSDSDAAVILHQLVMALRSDADRELFLMRVRGRTFPQIAQVLRASAATLRQRWCSVRRELRSRLRPDQQARWREVRAAAPRPGGATPE